jgi:calcium-dependent protein kinase
LKPENFLYSSNDDQADLKLIDFGLSNKYQNRFGQQFKMNSVVGTAHYVAPEVLKGSYGPACDAWSIGVIMYMMLSGSFPFDGNSETIIFRAILNENIDLVSGPWKQISGYAKDLINKLLTKDSERRISVSQAL